jgi:hypothetical protein
MAAIWEYYCNFSYNEFTRIFRARYRFFINQTRSFTRFMQKNAPINSGYWCKIAGNRKLIRITAIGTVLLRFYQERFTLLRVMVWTEMKLIQISFVRKKSYISQIVPATQLELLSSFDQRFSVPCKRWNNGINQKWLFLGNQNSLLDVIYYVELSSIIIRSSIYSRHSLLENVRLCKKFERRTGFVIDTSLLDTQEIASNWQWMIREVSRILNVKSSCIGWL